MSSFMISYDLIGPDRNYNELYSAIQNYGTYAHINESLWIIRSSKTSTAIRDDLKKHIDNNDKLLVAQLNGSGAWTNLSQDISSWLKNNL